MLKYIVAALLVAAPAFALDEYGQKDITGTGSFCKSITKGEATAAVRLSNTWTGTVTWQVSFARLTAEAPSATFALSLATRTMSSTATVSGLYLIPIAGASQVCASYVAGTGTVTVFFDLSPAQFPGALAILSDNIATLGGTAIDTNAGTASGGTQRVVVATDQPTLTNPLRTAGGAAGGAGAATQDTVKVASTAAVLTDTARVVSISPAGDPCVSSTPKSSVAISLAAAATTQLVALSGSTVISVCGFVLTSTGATTTTTALFEYGTGALCATGLTTLTGTMGQSLLTSAVVTVATGGTQFKTAAGAALCIVVAGTTPSVQGYVTYVQQ